MLEKGSKNKHIYEIKGECRIHRPSKVEKLIITLTEPNTPSIKGTMWKFV